MSCGSCGPGYASPKEAFSRGAREKLLYIPCIIPSKDRPDYLSTVDVDPDSPTFCQASTLCSVIHFLRKIDVHQSISIILSKM